MKDDFEHLHCSGRKLKQDLEEEFYHYYFMETSKRLKIPFGKFLQQGKNQPLTYTPKSINSKYVSLIS